MTRAIRLSPARGEDYGEGCFEFFRTLHLQIASAFLFLFQSLEQRFEISFPETLRAFALDNFEEQRRPIFDRLRKYLEQITFVVAIDQNPKAFQRRETLSDSNAARGGVWYVIEG